MTLRNLNGYLVNTHVPTAFYAASMTWYSLDLLKIHDVALIIFVFWATLCSYNFHKWINLQFEQQSVFGNTIKRFPYRSEWDLQNKNIFLLLILFSLMLLLIQADVFIKHFKLFLTAFILTLIYTLPNLPFKPFLWLRKIAIAKTFFLATVWTFITIYIPFEIYLKVWNIFDVIFLLQRLTFIYSICILFDERDKSEDILKGIRSISTMIKPYWIRFMFYASVLCSITCSILLFKTNPSMALPTIIPSLITLFLFNTYKGKSLIYYTVFLDGLMALSAFIHFISHFDLFLHP